MTADWPETPPDRAPPPPGAVACWRILVDTIDETALYQTLPPQERSRVDRYINAEDRRRCVAARAGIRALLEPVLGRPPVFVVGPHGKPACPDANLCFNISHGGGVVLIALSSQAPVGVDVEPIRPLPERVTLARRFFHPAEAAEIAALPEPAATEAFLRCWTRKEAVIKALGAGLSLPLNSFRVSCRAEDAPAVLIPPSGAKAWTLFDLAPATGHRGALAVMGEDAVLSLRGLTL